MKKDKIVIAHRGACGYLPEHSIAAKAMAYAMGPDYLEQDVVLTKDDRVVILHDHNHLHSVTNAAEIYPERRRDDGLFYIIDFTLEELKGLRMHERINVDTGEQVYDGRFPKDAAVRFEVVTLEEEIELIQGLNKTTGNNIGIYPELKAPRFHTEAGRDMAKITLDILYKYGYKDQHSKCYVQCFDPACIKYMRNDLKCRLPLVQLIADDAWDETPGVSWKFMHTERGLDEVARYADGIGPWMELVVTDRGSGRGPTSTDLVRWAHERYLVVHPFTVRADSLPSYVNSIDELFSLLYREMDVEGVFTDFSDYAVDYLVRNGLR